ncbi:MAG: flagellin [Candidatus Symbiobacter sp.]|nr:flagellin [Candidatus Symbiobacter sp.]
MTTTINTNPGSFVALHNLTSVQRALDATQKRVSTGYTVADAFDNGAVFGVAQLVRSDIAGNTAATAELGNFSGALQTANAGATAVSNTLSDIRTVLTHLSSQGLTATQYSQYIQQYNTLVDSVRSSVYGSAYNGTNLLSTTQSFQVLADGTGNTIAVNGTTAALIGVNGTGDSAYSALASIQTSLTTWNGQVGTNTITVSSAAASVQQFLTPSTATSGYAGTFDRIQNSTSTVLNYIGALNRQVTQQLDFNVSIRDALSTGLGALVDADLAQESAKLTALQVKQQLATQALSIANQGPNILTTLFR